MPATIDARPAAHRFRTVGFDGYAPGRNRPGYCTRWVWHAVMADMQNTVPLANAVDVWNYCPPAHRHAIPANGIVPAGGVIVLGASTSRHDANAWKGDVYVSDGTAAGNPATDAVGAGRIGGVTHAGRAQQTARPILGWVDWFGGYPLITAATPSPSTPLEESRMLPYSFVSDAKSTGVYVVGAKGRAHVQSPYHWTLLRRAQRNDGSDKMLLAELDIVQSYTRAICL